MLNLEGVFEITDGIILQLKESEVQTLKNMPKSTQFLLSTPITPNLLALAFSRAPHHSHAGTTGAFAHTSP